MTSVNPGSGQSLVPTAPALDELGPEVVVRVYDPATEMRGVLVIDNTVLGPAGGGARMMPNITEEEVAALARSMTFKFGILGLPRGGCKSGIWGDPSIAPAEKREVMRAFGKRLAPYIASKVAAIGPDMGITVNDVRDIYDGAGVEGLRTGLFQKVVDGDPAAYHITGHGVIAAAKVACEETGVSFEGARVALEGFGQVGVGVARRAHREGARVVAVTTLKGGIYNPDGLDIPRLLELRREHGDRCVQNYPDADKIATTELYFLPVEILVPGARPWVIREDNVDRVDCKIISSGGNITMTPAAQDMLFRRGVMPIPDFVSNSAAALSSWVDFLGGRPEQAFEAIDHRLSEVTRELVKQSLSEGVTPYPLAVKRVTAKIIESRGLPPKSFEQIKAEIKKILGM